MYSFVSSLSDVDLDRMSQLTSAAAAAAAPAAASLSGRALRTRFFNVPQSELASVGVLADFVKGLGEVGRRFVLRVPGAGCPVEAKKGFLHCGFRPPISAAR